MLTRRSGAGDGAATGVPMETMPGLIVGGGC